MLFNSFAFVIFLPVVFVLYWIIKNRYRWVIILVASYLFYMFSVPWYGLIIFGMTFISYFAAIGIEKTDSRKKQKFLLVTTVLTCFGVLFLFKYYGFISGLFSDLLALMNISLDFVTLNLVLPVGISIYTFQVISYIVDVWRGDTKAEKHFGRYAAYISFFPQLVAGPIERSRDFLPQLYDEHIFCYEQAIEGAKQMLWGYFKKLVIADTLSPLVKNVFDDPFRYKGFSLLLAALFFTIQIYCDFSGYSDIAIGTAKLFGFRLTTNFKCPYFSTSIKEFWSRWHITLSKWFRDYVYIPLGGNRVGRIKHSLNLMITFLASGLWHGANWTFVMWGGMHGLAQVIETNVFGNKRRRYGRKIKLLNVLLVFTFCMFAWVFFVSNSLEDAFYVITHSFVGIGDPIAYIFDGFDNIGFDQYTQIVFFLSMLILFLYDYIDRNGSFNLWISRKSRCLEWAFYIIIGLLIVFISNKGVAAEFIYFQF